MSNVIDVRLLRLHALEEAHARSMQVQERCTCLQEMGVKGQSIYDPIRPEGSVIYSMPIETEQVYAAVMHEVGHRVHPKLLNVVPVPTVAYMMNEEHLAWEWAKHSALLWTLDMEQLMKMALKTYDDAAALIMQGVRAYGADYERRIITAMWRGAFRGAGK